MKVEKFKIPSHFWLHARTPIVERFDDIVIYKKKTIEINQLENQF